MGKESSEFLKRDIEIIKNELVAELENHETGAEFSNKSIALLKELSEDYPEEYITLYMSMLEDALGKHDIWKAYKNMSVESIVTLYNQLYRGLDPSQRLNVKDLSNMKFTEVFTKKTGFSVLGNDMMALKVYLCCMAEVLKSGTYKNNEQFITRYIANPYSLLKALQSNHYISLDISEGPMEKQAEFDSARIEVYTQSIERLLQQEPQSDNGKEITEVKKRKELLSQMQNVYQKKVNTEKLEQVYSTPKNNSVVLQEKNASEEEKNEINKKMLQERTTADTRGALEDKKNDEKPKELFTPFSAIGQQFGKASMDDSFDEYNKDPTIVAYYRVYPEFSNLGTTYLFLSSKTGFNSGGRQVFSPGTGELTPVGRIQCAIENNSLLPVLAAGESKGLIKTIPLLENATLIDESGKKVPLAESGYTFSVEYSEEWKAFRVKTNYTGKIEYDVYVGYKEVCQSYTPEEIRADSKYNSSQFSSEAQSVLQGAKKLVDEGNYMESVVLLHQYYMRGKFHYTTMSKCFTADPIQRDKNPAYMYGDCDVLAEQLSVYLKTVGIDSRLQGCFMDTNGDGAAMNDERHAILQILFPNGEVLYYDVVDGIKKAPFQPAEATEVPSVVHNEVEQLPIIELSDKQMNELAKEFRKLMQSELEPTRTMNKQDAAVYIRKLLDTLESKERISAVDAAHYLEVYKHLLLFDTTRTFSPKMYAALYANPLYMNIDPSYVGVVEGEIDYGNYFISFSKIENFSQIHAADEGIDLGNSLYAISPNNDNYSNFMRKSGRLGTYSNPGTLGANLVRIQEGTFGEKIAWSAPVVLSNGSTYTVGYENTTPRKVILDDYEFEFTNIQQIEETPSGILIVDDASNDGMSAMLFECVQSEKRELGEHGELSEFIEVVRGHDTSYYIIVPLVDNYKILSVDSAQSPSESVLHESLETNYKLYDVGSNGFWYIQNNIDHKEENLGNHTIYFGKSLIAQVPFLKEGNMLTPESVLGGKLLFIGKSTKNIGNFTIYALAKDGSLETLVSNISGVCSSKSGDKCEYSIDIHREIQGKETKITIRDFENDSIYTLQTNKNGNIEIDKKGGLLPYPLTHLNVQSDKGGIVQQEGGDLFTVRNANDVPILGNRAIIGKNIDTDQPLQKSDITKLYGDVKPLFFTHHQANYHLLSTDPLFWSVYENASLETKQGRIYDTLLRICWGNEQKELHSRYLEKMSEIQRTLQSMDTVYTKEIEAIQKKKMIDTVRNFYEKQIPDVYLKEWKPIEVTGGTIDGKKVTGGATSKSLQPGSPERKEAILRYHMNLFTDMKYAKQGDERFQKVKKSNGWDNALVKIIRYPIEVLPGVEQESLEEWRNSVKKFGEVSKGDFALEQAYAVITGTEKLILDKELVSEKSRYVLKKTVETAGYKELIKKRDSLLSEYALNQDGINVRNKTLLAQYGMLPDEQKVELFHELINFQPHFLKEYIYALHSTPISTGYTQQEIDSMKKKLVDPDIIPSVKDAITYSLGVQQDGTYRKPPHLEMNQKNYNFDNAVEAEEYRMEMNRKELRVLNDNEKIGILDQAIETYLTETHTLDFKSLLEYVDTMDRGVKAKREKAKR